MVYENLGGSLLDYAPCRYGKSKLLFRGPRRRLSGDYVAFLGGTETYGKFIEQPFPVLVEQMTGTKSINFGCVNAGAEVYCNDQSVLDACADARATVVQVTGAQNISNRFYSVHPRRNDRFVRATTVLHTLYPEVDFTEFNFTRHLLTSLHDLSPERFELVRRELRRVWTKRMEQLLGRVGEPVILLWLADHRPNEGASDGLGHDPLFVDAPMLRRLDSFVTKQIEIVPPRKKKATDGMVFSPMEAPAAAASLGVPAHKDAADALAEELRRLL